MTIDITHQIGAVTRTVTRLEHEGRPAHAVIAARTFDASIGDLWDALTNPDRIPRWFLPVTGDLHQGGRFQLQGNACGDILRCEPPRHLAVTWEFGAEVSWVSVQLNEEGAGRTRFVLEHVAHDSDHFRTFGPGATGVGWDLAIAAGLARHLASGEAVDPQQAEAWTMSDEGKIFIARSSDAWCQAAIAAGVREADARAAAARTTSFYTGAGEPAAPADAG